MISGNDTEVIQGENKTLKTYFDVSPNSCLISKIQLVAGQENRVLLVEAARAHTHPVLRFWLKFYNICRPVLNLQICGVITCAQMPFQVFYLYTISRAQQHEH
jgi:hypothetical protein